MKHVNFLKKSLMALVGLFLVSGISTLQAAVLYEFEFDGTDEAYYLFGGNFTRCSDNGEFAVGYSWMTGIYLDSRYRKNGADNRRSIYCGR